MADRRTREKIRELEERLEALVIAVPKEEAAYHFYMDLAQATQNEWTRKMFLKLADEELDHKHHLEDLIKGINKELAKLKAPRKRG